MKIRICWFSIAVMTCAMLVVSGCGEDGTSMGCTPGDSKQCSCSNGATGAQICKDDGSGHLECICQAINTEDITESDAGDTSSVNISPTDDSSGTQDTSDIGLADAQPTEDTSDIGLEDAQPTEDTSDIGLEDAQPTEDTSEPTEVPEGWVSIPAGTFTMGSPESDNLAYDDEFPAHDVTLTRAFALQSTEVTQSQWESLMGNNPSSFGGCPDCPVEEVNWYEALSYCNALSEQEGYESCYTLSGCSNSPGFDMECSNVEWVGLDCTGYRLPTEAEWEYAYRAGTTSRWYCGDNESCVDSIGWYLSNSGKTHAVAQKTPNAWGLYDMAGNVWEWTWDWYASDYYATSPASDPTGPSMGSNRVFRGGSWSGGAWYLRAANRSINGPGSRIFILGFRPARSLNP